MKTFAWLIVGTLLAASGVSAGNMYRWVDSAGKVHYTDHPPPPEAKRVEQKNLGGNMVQGDDLPYATRVAVKNFPVTVFINECGEPCTKAREHLSKRGIPYTSRNPETNPADAEALKKLTDAMEVPVLVVGNTTPIRGYEPGSWDTALDAAGYPRSGKSRTPPATR